MLGLNFSKKQRFNFVFNRPSYAFNSAYYLNLVYHFAFIIPHNRLNEALEWTKKKVEIVDVTPGDKITDFLNWNDKSFYFYDNHGNILEFIAQYALDNNSAVPFNTDSIISTSEIGIATEDVATEKWLTH